MKICFKCNHMKPLSEFYRHSQMKDGHLNKYKECAKLDVSSNYKNNRDYYVEYYKKREQTEKRKLQKTKYQKNRRAKNPTRVSVYNKVKRSKLIRPNKCQKCGKTAKLNAHHENYNAPLEVIWVCAMCHYYIHKESV